MSEAELSPAEVTARETAAAKAAEYRAKFEGQAAATEETPVEETQGPVRPEHVPEKFWNAETGEVNYEAWNKAHTELETKFHKGSQETDGAASEETPSDDKSDTAVDTPEAETVLETPAAQRAAENYAANGELSEDDYAALEKQGITRELVDTYIAGQEAKAAAAASAAFEPAGGEENYRAMIEWSVDNLSTGEKKAFNAQMTTGDPDIMRAAVSSLYGRFSQNAPVEGDRVGGSVPSNDSSTFASRAEMTAAINKVENGKRLYDTDAGYRESIMRKIGATRRAGKVF